MVLNLFICLGVRVNFRTQKAVSILLYILFLFFVKTCVFKNWAVSLDTYVTNLVICDIFSGTFNCKIINCKKVILVNEIVNVCTYSVYLNVFPLFRYSTQYYNEKVEID